METQYGAPQGCQLTPLDCAMLATSIYAHGNTPPAWILAAAGSWLAAHGYTEAYLRPDDLALRTNDRGGTSGQHERSTCGPGNAAVAQTYLRWDVSLQDPQAAGDYRQPRKQDERWQQRGPVNRTNRNDSELPRCAGRATVGWRVESRHGSSRSPAGHSDPRHRLP